MAVEIKELHIKTSIRGDSAPAEKSQDAHSLKQELTKYCQRKIQELWDRQNER